MKIFSLLLISVGASFAQNDKPPQHYIVFFVSAEEFKNGPIEKKTAYLSGWQDSRLNAGAFGNTKTIQAMRDCAEGKTITQIAAIVDKYMQGHPEAWDRPAALEADAALQSVCPALGRAVNGQ
jgi:hypothetical protein